MIKDAENGADFNLIYVSLYFPPLGNAGTLRNTHFTKYLPEFGITPIVITSKAWMINSPRDYSLFSKNNVHTKVYRMNVFDLSWLYKVLWGLQLSDIVKYLQNKWLYPDQFILWKYSLRKLVLKLIIKHKAKAVYISVSPFSALEIISYIRERSNIPIFIDFRDEWTNNPYRHFANLTSARIKNEKQSEYSALLNCSGVVYNNEMMKQNFVSRYPFLKTKPSKVVYNGFDPDDFDNAISGNYLEQATIPQLGNLRIVYTGAFYDHQNPKLIWEALHKLDKTGQIDLTKITIQVYGKNNARFIYDQIYSNDRLKQAIHLLPYLNHADAVTKMLSADILLLFIAGGGNSQAVLTTKLFEYLAAYKPIWAIIPEIGEAANIINQSRTGWIGSSKSVESIMESFLALYKLWQTGELRIDPDVKYIKTFSRVTQVKELAALLVENCTSL